MGREVATPEEARQILTLILTLTLALALTLALT